MNDDPPPGRLAWIDWLKVVAVTGVLAYHAAQPFVLTTWIVVDRELSVVLSALAGLGYLFGMPLMFLLAGAASWIALRSTPVAAYLGKRLRLAIPLVSGLLVLSPLQTWIGALTRGEATALPDFVAGFWADAQLTLSPIWLGTYGYHLWFIGFLLAYAVVSVPVLARLVPRDRLPVGPMGLLLGPLVLLVATQIPLRSAAPAYRDWADFVLWFVYFLLGAAVVAWPPLLQGVGRHGWATLGPALAATIGMASLFLVGDGFALESAPGLDLAGIGYVALRTATGWCWVVVALWIGLRWMDRAATRARAASELVLPFYVLHHPFIVIVAAAVVAWPVPWWTKYPVILAASFALSLGAAAAVARTPVLRVLLGMAPTRRLQAAPLAA